MRILLCALLAAVLCGGCAKSGIHPTQSSAYRPAVQSAGGFQKGDLDDIARYPQNLEAYVSGNALLLDAVEQTRRDAAYGKRWLAPWHSKPAGAKRAFPLPREWKGSRGYHHGLRQWTPQQKAFVSANTDAAAYPSRCDCALTVRATSVREVPTDMPLFVSVTKPGGSYPFDMIQYSNVPIGMPVLVTHQSADGAWVFVETGLVDGWIRAEDVAVVNDADKARWEAGPRGAVIRENVIFEDSRGRKIATAGVGAVLPMEDDRIIVPLRQADGAAKLVLGKVKPGDVVPMPLPLTAQAVAKVGNACMGQPYAWGGMYGGRDCSSLMRDVFAPFGLWLPRNSKAQRKAWYLVPLSGSPEVKYSIITSKGKPFASLLCMPGHVMLYIGERNGTPLVFHAFWGVRTKDLGGDGRFIVGKVAVTSLEAGRELPNSFKDGLLVHRLNGMSVLQEQ